MIDLTHIPLFVINRSLCSAGPCTERATHGNKSATRCEEHADGLPEMLQSYGAGDPQERLVTRLVDEVVFLSLFFPPFRYDALQ